MSEEEKAPKPKKTEAHDRAWWSKKIAACERSGKSMVEYAREHDLKVSSMYNWKTTLRKSRKQKNRATSIPMTFVEVTSPMPNREYTLEIVSPGGWTARIPSQMDNETASRFLALIGAQQ